jgi:hypothetical protein
MVQARTRIMNQLQAVALNEGLRYKKRLWREAGAGTTGRVPVSPLGEPRLNPTIANLTQAMSRRWRNVPRRGDCKRIPGSVP